MARQIDIKLDDGTWMLCSIEPDWEKINMLASRVDDGDLSVLDELIDLIIYEKETATMMKYIELGVKNRNDKARCIKGRLMQSWNISKLILFRELAKKDVLNAKYIYDETKVEFGIFYGGIIIILLLAAALLYAIYWLIV